RSDRLAAVSHLTPAGTTVPNDTGRVAPDTYHTAHAVQNPFNKALTARGLASNNGNNRAFTTNALTFESGDYIVFCIAMKRNEASTLSPQVSVRVNASGDTAKGSATYAFTTDRKSVV